MKIASVVVISLLSTLGFSSSALANCEIKVCHCNSSQVESSKVGLNNEDGNATYDETSIERGSCKTLKGTNTSCFVVFKHYATSATRPADSELASSEVAYSWLDNPDKDANYKYILSYGGKCD